MNELLLTLSEKLDMSYDMIINAYPEIANQIMYFNIFRTFENILYVTMFLSVVSLLISRALYDRDFEGKGSLLHDLNYIKTKIHLADFGDEYKELLSMYINKIDEFSSLEDKNKNKYSKYMKYSISTFITSLLLLFVSGVLTNILAKDFIALATILAGLN